MDGGDRGRKQYGDPTYTSASPMTPLSAPDRYRQNTLPSVRAEYNTTSMHRTHTLPNYGTYGYADQQTYGAQTMPHTGFSGSNMPYAADFAPETRESQSQQQSPQQSFPQYSANVIYNAAQNMPSQSSYDTTPQYQQRQSAAIEVLSNQFGVQPYFESGDASQGGMQPYIQSHIEAPTYGQHVSVSRNSLQQGYSSNVAEYPSMSQPSAGTRDVPSSHVVREDSDQAYHNYKQQVKATYESTSSGNLVAAANGLLDLSRWLLSRVDQLGQFMTTRLIRCETDCKQV